MERTSKSRRRAAPSRLRDRARHEDEILATAERLFARKGYTAATMVEVAAEAGFAIATLYNLFGSKEAMLQALLARHPAALTRVIAAATERAPTPRAKLEASVLARVKYLGAHRDFFLLYVSAIPGGAITVPHDAVAIARAVTEQLARIEEIFRELPGALDAATRALVFYGATRTWIIERVLKAKRPPPTREVAAVVRALLDGLAPEPESKR